MSNKEIYDTNEAAKKFKPQLKELIIATSADSDVNTQEYTREINKKNKENNILMEDIVCDSPSAAGWVVMGKNNNGWMEWKNEKQEPLDKYRK